MTVCLWRTPLTPVRLQVVNFWHKTKYIVGVLMFPTERQKKNECVGTKEVVRNLFNKHLPWEFLAKMKGGQTGETMIFLPLLWFM